MENLHLMYSLYFE